MVKPLFTVLVLFSGIIASDALHAQSVWASLVSAPLTAVPRERPGPGLSPDSRPAGLTPVTLRIFHDSSRKDFANIGLDWQILANGVIRQKGAVFSLIAAPGRPALVRLSVRTAPGNEELYLRIRYSYKKSLLREEQLLLRAWTGGDLVVRPAGDLSFSDNASANSSDNDNDQFSVLSPTIRLQFNKQTGWLQRYEWKGLALLSDTLRPANEFWRTAHLQLFSTSTGSQLVIVRTEYTLPGSACLLHLSYTINAAGELLVEPSIEPDSTQKHTPLPRFNLQWNLPPGFDSVTWYGGSTGTTTPAIFHDLAAPGSSSAPGQDTSVVRSSQTAACKDVRWWRVTSAGGTGLLVTADSSLLTIEKPFTINCPEPSGQPPSGNYRYAFRLNPVLLTNPVIPPAGQQEQPRSGRK
jgi:beta-galactosidase